MTSKTIVKPKDKKSLPGEEEIGSSQIFVRGKGFKELDGFAALVGSDNTLRLFAELLADPDRPEVRPGDAYQAILTSMQPGWTIRLLQIFWPDPLPREHFRQRTASWPSQENEGMDILKESLNLFIQQAPLPFTRRTVLEFVYPDTPEAVSWWAGVAGLVATFGVRMIALNKEEITTLSRGTLNPFLD